MLFSGALPAQITFQAHPIVGGDFRADGPRDVIAVDLDRDGDMDLVSAANQGHQIFWHENDGAGHFTTHLVSTVTSVQGAIAVQAFDYGGDSDIDIVAASNVEDKIFLFVNDGTNQFPTAWEIASGVDGVYDIFAIDMNGDGHKDIISASANNDRIIWHEDIGGAMPTFFPHLIQDSLDAPRAVYARDLDGDTDVDVVAAFFNGDQIAWFENDGNNQFTAHIIDAAANGANGVYVADIQNDGDMDILATTKYGREVILYQYHNQTYGKLVLSAGINSPTSIVAADVDGDGQNDVLATFSNEQKVVWFQYPPGGGWPFIYNEITNSANGANAVLSTDIDGDGIQDIVSSSFNDDKIAWYKQDATGQFTPRDVFVIAQNARAVHAVDLDDDGDLDVLSASSGDNKIAWYENLGNGQFHSYVISSNARQAWDVSVADIDADGDMDVVSVSFADDKVAYYENDGNQNFTELDLTFFIKNIGPRSLKIADADADGDLDILFSMFNRDGAAWCINQGAGIFVLPLLVVTNNADGANAVDAADMDGDGDMDVLIASMNDNKFAWYEYAGAEPALYTEHLISTTANNPWDILAADLDQDGDIDVVTASSGDNTIAWYENDGNLQFSQHVISTTASQTKSIHVADVDGDGDLDVLGVDFTRALWFENDGNMNFSEIVISNDVSFGYDIFTADLNGDGRLDILTASELDDQIAWFQQMAPTGLEEQSPPLPNTFLLQNHPNPFNPATQITFGLPEMTRVSLVVYDLFGRSVKTLVNGPRAAGAHTVQWNSTDHSGNPVSSGIYFYRLQAGEFQQVRKMILLR
ncbi:MAG: FG-GAP-like repeat-containing protein [candidate division KSB1 bacterium]|nr:FG-GAP-like repeat-containing protein [candidate division KSB1 bacterium]